MPSLRVLRTGFVLGALASLSLPALALAQEPIDQPSDFAAVRDRFESMIEAEWEAAGYSVIPPGDCVASPAGGMGVHAINPQLIEAQFPTGELDLENPPLILLDASKTRVIGLEWEAADIGQEAPTAFGQTVALLPGHPGVPDPHYMLHAYFRPNDQVLFADFDPLVKCDPMPRTDTIATDERAQGRVSLVALAMAAAGLAVWLAAARARRAE